MRRLPLILAAFAMLAACATAPEPEPELPPEIAGPTERYGPLIEQQAMEMVAAEPAVFPRGLQVSILSVEETSMGLFYNAELHAPAQRREDRDYVIYGQCQASDLASCASQIVSGARMLRE